jgi:hypothetical protein
MSDTNAIVLSYGDDFLVPAAPLNTMIGTYQAKKDFITHVLAEGVDFGKIPGAGDKPALFKAGAEKMTSFFGLAPIFEDVETVEDWTGSNHGGEQFFYYRQRCILFRGIKRIGSADGSCNSWEKKYRYRWVQENDVPTHLDKSKLKIRGGRVSEFSFALDKAETTGQYGKPAAYWQQFKDAVVNGTAANVKRKTKNGKEMDAVEIDSTLYCIPNDDMAEQVNTILKMAQKRALVAAVLIATNISDYFTQDIDDYTDRPIVDEAPKQSHRPTDPEVTTTPGEFEPAPVSAPMTLAEAQAVETSQHQKYGDMPVIGLEKMRQAIEAKITANGMTPEVKADYIRKLTAINVIQAPANAPK